MNTEKLRSFLDLAIVEVNQLALKETDKEKVQLLYSIENYLIDAVHTLRKLKGE